MAWFSRNRGAWRHYAPAVIFTGSSICTSAFEMNDLPERELSGFEIRGVLRKTIHNFRLRCPDRGIRHFHWSAADGGENPNDAGTSHDQPIIPGRPTRWDMDLTEYWHPTSHPDHRSAQRIMIRFVLSKGIEFFPNIPPITAKSKDSLGNLCNPVVDTDPSGRHRVSFWALKHRDTDASQLDHAFNIAIVAEDALDGRFALPIIIDPSIRNSG